MDLEHGRPFGVTTQGATGIASSTGLTTFIVDHVMLIKVQRLSVLKPLEILACAAFSLNGSKTTKGSKLAFQKLAC